jgi:hypothetical protein
MIEAAEGGSSSLKASKPFAMRRHREFRDSVKSTEIIGNSMGVLFDSHRPLQTFAKFTLIRLPLLTWDPSIVPQKAGFCVDFAPKDKRRE